MTPGDQLRALADEVGEEAVVRMFEVNTRRLAGLPVEPDGGFVMARLMVCRMLHELADDVEAGERSP